MKKKTKDFKKEEVKKDVSEEQFSYVTTEVSDKKDIKYKSYTLGKRLGIKK